MLKLKLFAVAGALVFVGIVLSVSPKFATSAKTDVAQEIAGYKNWTRITKEPIRVEFESPGG